MLFRSVRRGAHRVLDWQAAGTLWVALVTMDQPLDFSVAQRILTMLGRKELEAKPSTWCRELWRRTWALDIGWQR